MSEYPSIASYLPVSFGNGQQVKSFGKECPSCRKVVMAETMFGRLVVVQDRILLAAQGHCPHCGHRFPITCVITDDKKVSRVYLPMGILRWWLSTVHGEANAPREQKWESHPSTTLPEHVRLPKQKVSLAQFDHYETIIGSYNGYTIYEWIEVDSKRYKFERVVPKGVPFHAAPGEILVEHVLVYRDEGSF